MTTRHSGMTTAALALALAVAACFSEDITPPPPAAANVSARNVEFVEDTVFVAVGETVRWTVVEGQHSVTGDPSKALIPGSARLPAGAEAFDSGIMNEGETFEHTFAVAGTYKYFCIPHEALGMVGWVIVQ